MYCSDYDKWVFNANCVKNVIVLNVNNDIHWWCPYCWEEEQIVHESKENDNADINITTTNINGNNLDISANYNINNSNDNSNKFTARRSSRVHNRPHYYGFNNSSFYDEFDEESDSDLSHYSNNAKQELDRDEERPKKRRKLNKSQPCIESIGVRFRFFNSFSEGL